MPATSAYRTGSSLCFAILLGIQTAVPQSFYPLQVGNRWDYAYAAYDFFGQVTRDTFTVSVVGIANLPNGMTYFELDGPEISWFTYVRIDSGRVHYFSMLDTADVMMYDLHAELNDSWPSESRYFSYIGLTSVDTLEVFGSRTARLGFVRDGLILSTVWLSERFGPLEYYSPGEPPGTGSASKILIGCVISDTTYGLLVGVPNPGNPSPPTFSLNQNFPNPFNSSTTITFGLPVSGSADLSIFDCLGRCVYSWQGSFLRAGHHRLTWNSGNTASGVYYYRFNAGQFSETKRMILVK